MPGWIAAGTYSAVTNYLAAVEKAGTDEATAVLDALEEMEIADFFIQNGALYPNGRLIHDMYLVEVKSPKESKRPWDYLKVLRTIPGDQAYAPMSDACPYVK